MKEESKKKSSARGKKDYTGIVIRNFGFKGKKYNVNDTFTTKDRKTYDNLINIKRIK